MNTMSTGERIRALRIQKGMSQEELGSRVGLKKAAINKYETGVVVNLKRSVIAKLADVLETSPAYLMGWEEHEVTIIPKDDIDDATCKEVSVNNRVINDMLKTFGAKYKANRIHLSDNKVFFIYYYGFSNYISAAAASRLVDLVENLPPDDALKLRLLAEAYLAADDRARQMVDLALDPFIRKAKDKFFARMPHLAKICDAQAGMSASNDAAGKEKKDRKNP